MKQKGFTLIELIIVIAILGIIALIAVPNLAGIRQRAQVSADKRTAEQIGKAVRIWETDIGEGQLPTTPTKYYEISGVTPLYISSGYTAKSYEGGNGAYYVCAVGEGYNQKIAVGIGDSTSCNLATPSSPVNITYGYGEAGWAYCEGAEGTDWVLAEGGSGGGSSTAIMANSDVQVGDYIAYTGGDYSGKWVVLRNSGGVIEIISKESVGNLTLGGSSLHDTEKAKSDYANCVQILNDKCATYVNSTYATSGRSVGATSSSIAQIDTTANPLTFDAARSAVLPYSDTYYTTDQSVISGNANLKHSSGYVWLASRGLNTYSSTSHFYVRCLGTSGSVSYNDVFIAGSDGSAGAGVPTDGVRPVITLKSGIKITGGTGDVGNPYTIGL